MKLWLAIQWNGDDKPFDIQGIFSSEEKARDHCLSQGENAWKFGYGMLTLDEALPAAGIPWPTFKYPYEESRQ